MRLPFLPVLPHRQNRSRVYLGQLGKWDEEVDAELLPTPNRSSFPAEKGTAAHGSDDGQLHAGETQQKSSTGKEGSVRKEQARKRTRLFRKKRGA